MSDLRCCTVCNQFIDIAGMTVFGNGGGRGRRATVVDPATKVAHIVLNKNESARKAQEQK